MPSLQDVADQINAKLDELIVNTAVTAQVRDGVINLNNSVSNLDVHMQAGMANIAGGLLAIWELEKASLAELRHHSEQNDTVICLLQNANELLCGITRKLTMELRVSQDTNEAVRRMEGIVERGMPAAAGDYDRLRQVKDTLAECCPPQPVEPEPCPEPCPVRQHKPYQPKGQDWKPAALPKPEG
ncbi:hypothetical protein QTQ03_03435 [Micromonospora sp. WMMA1363]|uniref:hypothetical protein n=1 Tax=Micromonospora sp. WMMA1363 TaxID=3053985 RepID=UPI00259CC249|nr:hypothetical protein [Micromonospora sp. WMMA1363]MDM4718692.1 hypothetical protein [Micromonospora sp. WMMA1363]